MALFSNETPDLGRGTKSFVTISASLAGTAAATAGNYGVIFVADRDYEIIEARESHTTAGSDAGAVTLQIEKLTGTQALDAGVATLASTFNLKGTANTVQKVDATTTTPNNKIAAGDRLALKDTGVLTAVAGVAVTLVLRAI